MFKSLLSTLKSPLITAQRYAHKNQYKWTDGIKYPGFTYYPRTPDFKDPPYEATKLFRVQRVKPIKGQPYWNRRILHDLGLDGKKSEVAIIKNIPENNARLWRVKHLIQISPITFPNGFPKPNEVSGSLLKENGEFVVIKQLQPTQEQLESLEKFKNDPKKLDNDTLRKESRLKWMNAWSSMY